MPVVTLRTVEPGDPHPRLEDLQVEANASPLLAARGIVFTYYAKVRGLLVETDRVLEGDELAALEAVLLAHAGEPADG